MTGQNVTRPVFVVGCERSGTSALWRALCQHPQLRQQGPQDDGRPMATVKELWYLYEFFLGRELHPHRPHAGSDLDAEFVRRFAGLVDEFCTQRYAGPSGRWLSARPNDAFYLDQILELFPAAQVLFLMRHPQETVWSYLHASFSRQGTRRAFLRRAANTTQRWRTYAECYRASQEGAHAGRVSLVRHERMLHEPAATSAEILDFLGEPADPAVAESLGRVINSSFHQHDAAAAQLRQPQDELAADGEFCRTVVAEVGDWMAQLCHADLGGGVSDLHAAWQNAERGRQRGARWTSRWQAGKQGWRRLRQLVSRGMVPDDR